MPTLPLSVQLQRAYIYRENYSRIGNIRQTMMARQSVRPFYDEAQRCDYGEMWVDIGDEQQYHGKLVACCVVDESVCLFVACGPT